MASSTWLCVILALAPACAATTATTATTAAQGPADWEAVLKRQSQELLDAVAPGRREVWDRYLDPGVMYLSEAGELEDKPRLLAELTPLPAGVSGYIAIGRWAARRHGDTAIVFHSDEETENYFGHMLHAQYLNTATWRLGPAGWRLLSWQVYASLLDPPAIALPGEQLDEYVGTYQLTDEIHYTIRRDGDGLVGQRDGRPVQVLQVEARDVLFVPGLPRSRKVFGRDARGRVTQFADRREARDVVWTRLAPAP